MNITPDTEPLGSAQRALELAERLKAGDLRVIDSVTHTTTQEEAIEAILHHYAEIAPKWQAVLEAEVVGKIHHGRMANICWTEDPEELEFGTQLIIKPAP